MTFNLSRNDWMVVLTAAFLMLWVIRSRNPKAGFLGALIIDIVGSLYSPADARGATFQLATAFLVLHSLRWNNTGFDVVFVRLCACAAWLLDTIYLMHTDSSNMLPLVCGTGAFALVVCGLLRYFSGDWKSSAVPIAATLVLLARPGDLLAVKLFTAPAGVLAVAASFALFALGTWAALTKSRWNRQPAPAFLSPNKQTQ